MLLLALQLLTVIPAPHLAPAAPPAVRLLDRELVLAQGPEAGGPQAARDHYAGAFSPMEALIAALAISGLDSVVLLGGFVGFVLLGPTLPVESALLVLSLYVAGVVVLDALLAPLVAALVVTAVAGPGIGAGGFGGALSTGFLASGVALLLSLVTSFTPLLATMNPLLATVGITLGLFAGVVHTVGIPIAASFGLHRSDGSSATAAPTALALSGPAGALAGPMPALVLARF